MELEQLLKTIRESDNIDEKEILNNLYSVFCKDMLTTQFDLFREERTGVSEVVYCKGKSVSALENIIEGLSGMQKNYLFTKLTDQQISYIKQNSKKDFELFEDARCAQYMRVRKKLEGNITLLTAGTSDIYVAREAEVTLRHFGHEPQVIYDVGVSSLARLLVKLDEINSSDVVIVFAGMEGALPTVVASLTYIPLIAVPINAGYGANLEGVATLLSMINSCAPGITTVNIDNGFGAATAAMKIVRNKYKEVR